jgi:asparagine synthase (glutamine-hydrolysing)
MCGIVGKIDFSGRADVELLHRMCDVIEHRGPDSRGVFVDGGVGLGVQRLAIIDVAGGDQPIFNEDQSLAVVQNGEIYNFEQLRDQLIRRGHRFSSHADTEVLVHLYEDHLSGRRTHPARSAFRAPRGTSSLGKRRPTSANARPARTLPPSAADRP